MPRRTPPPLSDLHLPDGTHVRYRAWLPTATAFCTPAHEAACLDALWTLQRDTRAVHPDADLWSAVLVQMDVAVAYPPKTTHPLLATLGAQAVDNASVRAQFNAGLKAARAAVDAVDPSAAAADHVTVARTGRCVALTYRKRSYTLHTRVYQRIHRQHETLAKTVGRSTTPLNDLVWMGMHRYNCFGLYNNSQGSTTERHYAQLHARIGTSVEGFGSFFNHTRPYYFGLFPDLEWSFGCLGNAFHAELRAGFFVVNPPFTTPLMNRTIAHVQRQLAQATDRLRVLLVVPTWVDDERRELNTVCRQRLKVGAYEDEAPVQTATLRAHPCTLQYALYCKEHYLYHSFLTDRPTHFCATTTVLLSNRAATDRRLVGIVNGVMGAPTRVWDGATRAFVGRRQQRSVRRRRRPPRRANASTRRPPHTLPRAAVTST
jgi:hypothetical protein